MTNLDIAEQVVNKSVTLFWFRRDLRLTDNAGLFHALRENENVLPVFIFDTVILDKLEDKSDRRVQFIYETVMALKEQLESLGSTLLILYGDPVQLFKKLQPKSVYTNTDYEPYARSRDEKVSGILEKNSSMLLSFKDHVIFHQSEVTKEDGSPYTVFTPYSKKWKSLLKGEHTRAYATERYREHLLHTAPLPVPSAKEIGFAFEASAFPERKIKINVIRSYHELRDYPGVNGTSRLSVHLRFGTVSIRKLVALAKQHNEVWLNELIWREFYAMILWHFPYVEHGSFRPVFNQLQWKNDEDEFNRWCEGTTGYPLVDAGMRELNATGFMHNRVRMVTASFLTKHLLIDWRWGEAYFAKKLLDYDLASNNGGWQWAAGTGCDASPYFRVFNPSLQLERFDKARAYVRRWIPELDTDRYPAPMVAHDFARNRAIDMYSRIASS